MFQLKQDVTLNQIGSESLVHLPNGSSLVLNETGATFLNAALKGNIETAVHEVASNYQLPEEQIQFDASAFITEMLDKGVLFECGA